MLSCPKCRKEFAPPKTRGGYATLTMFRGGVLDTKVRCPGCGHVFQPRGKRVSSGLYKLVVGLLVAATVAGLLYLLLLKPLLK